MVFKSLAPSLNLQFISKMKILYFLCSLFILLFLLQVILNDKKKFFDFTMTDFTTSEAEKEYRKRFNLMDKPEDIGKECTLDYINEKKLAQDHPCVINIIRHMFMNSPSPRDLPYNLTTPGLNLTDITPGLYRDARNGSGMEGFLLKNKKKGFFVECGAFDGFLMSNTFHLEVNHDWTGLLIEASPPSYQRLLARNRKTWASNVCLSLMPYPTRIGFNSWDSTSEGTQALYRIIETDEEERNIMNDKTIDKSPFNITNRRVIKIQCFPFYSLLLASNHTTVDYFSLDIEGHEKRVLETIPWDKVDIKMMRIETMHIPKDQNNKSGTDALKEFLEAGPGYIKFNIDNADDIYMKNNRNSD